MEKQTKIYQALFGVSLAALAVLGFFTWRLYTQAQTTQAQMAEQVRELEEAVSNYQAGLAHEQQLNAELSQALAEEKDRVNNIQEQVAEITGTVGQLEKLRSLDPELLKKYSKVYFLNENYQPPKLAEIEEQYTFPDEKEYLIHEGVERYLERMLRQAESDNMPMQVISAFRSFGTQAAVKNGYQVTYGSGANQFSADQGYSEHQLGTTVDLTTPALGINFQQFDQSLAYEWMLNNAHKYGFVLSYPEGNAFYQFEPWHWRFVGKGLATKLHEEDKNFYDLDQRIIDSFLIAIFD
jgi:D-alanyl-D-alanine carboxypeptidase